MFKQISVPEAEQLMARSDLIIADVRDAQSYEEAHIEGAIYLSVSGLQEFCLQANKKQTILLYCYHGISSQSVAQHLVDQGFSQVYSLQGGFELWRQRVSDC